MWSSQYQEEKHLTRRVRDKAFTKLGVERGLLSLRAQSSEAQRSSQ